MLSSRASMTSFEEGAGMASPELIPSSGHEESGSAGPGRSVYLEWGPERGLDAKGFTQYVVGDGGQCLVWARGYFFDSGDHLRADEEIAQWVAGQLAAASLSDLAPRMNGCFTVIIVWPESLRVEVALDRLATVPVYALIGPHGFALSDDYWKVAKRVLLPEYDVDAVISMVLAGFVTGHATLLKDVSELANAAVHQISVEEGVPRLVSRRYWALSFSEPPRRSSEEWREGLADVLDRIFKRYGRAIVERDWTANVPLSGGQDSRLTVGLLHRYADKLQAFSYGPSGNEESQIASRVASVLGIPFRFAPIDDPTKITRELVRTMTRRVGMRVRFTAGMGAQMSLKDFSPTDTYLPAHPGGMVPYMQNSRVALLVRTEAQAVRQLADNMFWPVFDEMGASLFPGEWGQNTRRRVVVRDWDYEPRDPLGSMLRWEWDNQMIKMIISELRTYELFGRWLLPTADYEFTDFYAAVPNELRYEKRLYRDTMLQKLFVDDLAGLRRIPVAGFHYRGAFEVPPLSWRDRAILSMTPSLFGDWLLKRAARAKLREHRQTIDQRSPYVTGPDPIDHWWFTCPPFRDSVIAMFQGWDGMHGLVEVSALMNLLRRPLPRLFVRFVIPSLLTLSAFQDIVENDLGSIEDASDDPHGRRGKA
jgi:hypothetical protein